MKQRFLLLTAVFTFALVLVGSGFSQVAHAATPYNASKVLGQPDFTSSTAATTQSGMNIAGGSAVDNVHNRLFTIDLNNHRILVYDTTTITNGMNASYVLGQPDFTSNTPATTQSGINRPNAGLAYDAVNDRLFVNDQSNSRVLVYDTSTITNGMNASYVLGQPDFTSNTPTTTQSGMRTPGGMDYDPNNDRLFLADSGNRRVLVYDTATITNGMNASYVLGQPNFTTVTIAATQNGFRYTGDANYDPNSDRLFVSDTQNHRVMVFDVSTITNGMNASNVLGQPDFTSSTSATTQNGMNNPGGLTYDTTQNNLFVADSNNNRITVFNTNAITNGMNASYVIGQSDFTTGGACGAKAQNNFCRIPGLSFDPSTNRLVAGDVFGSRYLIFNFAKLNSTTPAATAGSSYSFSLGTQTQGTTSYSLTSGSLPPGLNLNSSTGQLSGTPSTPGTYNFTVSLSDDNGVAGVYSDTQAYTLEVAASATGAATTNPTAPNTGAQPGNLLASLALMIAGAGVLAAKVLRSKHFLNFRK